MPYTLKAVPEPQAILRAWAPFKQLIGVTSVRTEEDYAQARATIDALLNVVGDDEGHPLADVLDYLADRVKAYGESLRGRKLPDTRSSAQRSAAFPDGTTRPETRGLGRLCPAKPYLEHLERQALNQQGNCQETSPPFPGTCGCVPMI